MYIRKITSSNYLNESAINSRCVLNKVLKIIGKRWVPEILLQLSKQQPHRFSTLKNAMHGVSDQVLSNALYLLVRNKLVEKIIYQEVPPRVEYSLTPTGVKLVSHLHQLCLWGQTNMQEETPGK